MQSWNWNDLRVFLALYRTGKLRAAGKELGISDTTVTRRIKTLEAHLEMTLFLQTTSGRYQPTEGALNILPFAEAIEAQTLAINDQKSLGSQGLTGRVRISAVPLIVNQILIPNLTELEASYPKLRIELVPSAQNIDLTKREADLALRLARPTKGGLRTKAKRLGSLPFGAYGPAGFSVDKIKELAWIAYEDSMSHLPQARWLEAQCTKLHQTRAMVEVTDIESAREAIAHGLGKSLLPSFVAERDPRVSSLDIQDTPDLPERDVWLLWHADQSDRAAIGVVKRWIEDLF
ncbi:MAG: LysR family transcriptional regulator [Cognatishimia sp.]|nr:LysR family transcriptional regulator [Cognatishimia sp.]